VNLNRSVEVVLEMLRRTCSPQITLRTRLEPELPPVLADTTQMEQVIMNLCLNAIQASTPPATVEVITATVAPDEKMHPSLSADGVPYVRLQVKDEGCGMDEETASRIFEPFFTSKFTGRGMGLSAALGIVKSHQGQIEVDTAPGRGTTMTIWLPSMSPEGLAMKTAEEKRLAPMEPPRGSETILVVDDNPSITRTVDQILTSLGYIVIVRNDAEDALSFVDTNSEDIELVLLDVHMPKYSGVELHEIIRERCPGVPVILTSGYDQEDMDADLPERGVKAFLQKPFSIMDLAETIRKALDENPSARASR